MSDSEDVSPSSPNNGKASKKSPKIRFLAAQKHQLNNINPAKVPAFAPENVPRYMTVRNLCILFVLFKLCNVMVCIIRILKERIWRRFVI